MIGNWRQHVHLARKMTAVAAYKFSTSSPVRYRLEKMITQANQSTENGNPKQAETINIKKTINCWYFLEIRVVFIIITNCNVSSTIKCSIETTWHLLGHALVKRLSNLK